MVPLNLYYYRSWSSLRSNASVSQLLLSNPYSWVSEWFLWTPACSPRCVAWCDPVLIWIGFMLGTRSLRTPLQPEWLYFHASGEVENALRVVWLELFISTEREWAREGGAFIVTFQRCPQGMMCSGNAGKHVIYAENQWGREYLSEMQQSVYSCPHHNFWDVFVHFYQFNFIYIWPAHNKVVSRHFPDMVSSSHVIRH